MTPANQLRLDDGFATFITLENVPTIKLFEKEITPPGFQNGGPIDTTTMRNTAWRTAAAKKLKSASAIKATCAFATDVIDVLKLQLGINQLCSVHFPDGSTLQFYGWLDEFTPGNFVEGTQPTATCTFIPSLRDLDGNEYAPTYIAPVESSGA